MFARKLLLATAGLAAVAAFAMVARPNVYGDEAARPASAATTTPLAPLPSKDEVGAGSWLPAGSLASTLAEQGSVRAIIEVNADPTDHAALRSAQDAAVAAGGDGLQEIDRYDYLPFIVARVNSEALEALRKSPVVKTVTEDVASTPDDNDSNKMIGQPQAYDIGATGAGWTVAVLDTGFDLTHGFYSDRIVAQACFSTTDAASKATSNCPNGQASQVGAGAASNTRCTLSECTHGTHVAGIVAGYNIYFHGTAPKANLILVNIFSTVNGEARTFASDQLKGLEYVYSLRNQYKIASANMSIGGGKYTTSADCDAANPSLAQETKLLFNAGIPVVVAAGNDSYTDGVGAPGCLSSVITVGALDKDGSVASYSNSAKLVEIFAPGTDIYSSVNGGNYAYMSGTSMATPHVAGAFAALRSLYPNTPLLDLVGAMEKGPRVTDGRNGLSFGTLNFPAAISALGGPKLEDHSKPVAPGNDDVSSPRIINSNDYHDTLDTTAATTAKDDPSLESKLTCRVDGQLNHTVWYQFEAPKNGSIEITTDGSDYDTVLVAWVQHAGQTSEFDCDDDNFFDQTSTIHGDLKQGDILIVMVGARGDAGSMELQSSFDESWF
jgi:subtilisin family serine protease